jgi:hypothetical protein
MKYLCSPRIDLKKLDTSLRASIIERGTRVGTRNRRLDARWIIRKLKNIRFHQHYMGLDERVIITILYVFV